jgi:hypothetical protein
MTALRADQAVRARKVHSAARPSWFSQTHTAVPPSYAVTDGREDTHSTLPLGRPLLRDLGEDHASSSVASRGCSSCVQYSGTRPRCREKSRDSFRPRGTKLSLRQIGLIVQGVGGPTRRLHTLRRSQETMSEQPSDGWLASLNRPRSSRWRLSRSYSSGGDPA